MFSWLSTFLLNPALAVGAGVVASPILIHLLSKRRLQRVRWAAMDFLLEAYRKNRRRIRLEQLILLLLRCLAVLLIALMVMRPFMRSGALGALSGLRGKTERVLVLDDSFSTRYLSPRGDAGGQTTFIRLKQAALQLAERISEDSPADSLTLLLTSRPRQPLVALPSLSDDNLRKLTDQLDAISPTEGVSRMPDALSAIAEQLRTAPTQANHVVYVLSDFQRTDWAEPVVGTNTGPADVLASLSEIGRSLQLVLIDASADNIPVNIAITDIHNAQSNIVVGVPARFEIAISNYSDRALDRVEFTLRTSRHTLPPVLIPTLPAGQTIREPVEIVFGQEGSDYLEAHLVGGIMAADGVALDNTRIAAVEVVPAVRVLIVNGEPSSDNLRDEVYLLCTALHPTGRAVSGNELTVIEEQELEVTDLTGHDVVIFANVARISAGAQRRLEQFVQAGGGLVVFAGDQIDPTFYNERLYINGHGFLPAALTDTVIAPIAGHPFSFAEWDSGFPLMRDFVDQLATVLRQVRVYAYFGVRPDVITTTMPTRRTTTGATTIPDLPPATVIARFSDEDKSPAILERPFGRGRCILVNTSVDQEWNDWPSSFSYLPLMLRLVQYASRPTTPSGDSVVGATLACPLDPTNFDTRAVLRTPAYPIEPEIVLEASSAITQTATPLSPVPIKSAGPIVFRYDQTSKSGIYQFELRRNTGEGVSRYAAVNPNAAESNLTKAGRAELEAALGSSKFEYVRDVGTFAATAFDPRTEIWWPILIAALIVLMMEHSLAWWFGTKG